MCEVVRVAISFQLEVVPINTLIARGLIMKTAIKKGKDAAAAVANRRSEIKSGRGRVISKIPLGVERKSHPLFQEEIRKLPRVGHLKDYLP